MEDILSFPSLPPGLSIPTPPRRVVAFLNYKGEPEAERFFKALADGHKKSYLATFWQHADGQIPDHNDWHSLKRKHKTMKEDLSGLSEFLHIGSKTRLIAFDHHCNGQGMIIITHGFVKKENDLDPAQVREAKKRRDWFLSIHNCPSTANKPKETKNVHKRKRH